MYTEHEMVCEYCLNEFRWKGKELTKEGSRAFLICPFCYSEVDIEDLEDYDIFLNDIRSSLDPEFDDFDEWNRDQILGRLKEDLW